MLTIGALLLMPFTLFILAAGIAFILAAIEIFWEEKTWYAAAFTIVMFWVGAFVAYLGYFGSKACWDVLFASITQW